MFVAEARVHVNGHNMLNSKSNSNTVLLILVIAWHRQVHK